MGGTSDRIIINVFGLCGNIWRNKLLFGAPVLIFTAWAIAVSITATPIFKAQSTLLPHRADRDNAMARSLAMLSGGSRAGATYEDLIGEIVSSDRVIDSLIQTSWRYLGKDNVSLYEIFKIDREDSVKADYALRTRLRLNVIMVSRDIMTGFISISAKVPNDKQLAADVANAVVDEVMVFNRNFHSSHAAKNKIYLESRLEEIQLELEESESHLAEFVRNNRSYASSPDLVQQYGEMRRRVDASNAAWLEVRRQIEIAMLESHKGPSTFEVLDKARPPLYRSYPKRKIMVIFGFLVGAAIGFLLVLAKEYLPWSVLPERRKS